MWAIRWSIYQSHLNHSLLSSRLCSLGLRQYFRHCSGYALSAWSWASVIAQAMLKYCSPLDACPWGYLCHLTLPFSHLEAARLVHPKHRFKVLKWFGVKWFGESVYYYIFSRYIANLNLVQLNHLPYPVPFNFDMLVMTMELQVFGKGDRALVISLNQDWGLFSKIESGQKRAHQIASFVTSVRAIHSASNVNIATVDFSLKQWEIGPPANMVV